MDKKVILIVDDIFVNRILLSQIIKNAGYDFLEAENGKKAIEMITGNHVDLVFMDIEMPVMNGLETTQHIRKKLEWPKSQLPVIGLTAYNPLDYFSDFRDCGFTDLLTKPYQIEKIDLIIKKYLNK